LCRVRSSPSPTPLILVCRFPLKRIVVAKSIARRLVLLAAQLVLESAVVETSPYRWDFELLLPDKYDQLADGDADGGNPRKKLKVDNTTGDNEDIPVVAPLKTPKTTPKMKKPSPAKMAAYREEAIGAGTNATLLMTTLLNDTKLLIEIIQGKRDSKESDFGDITTRVEKAY
jgi:hypothetical protein